MNITSIYINVKHDDRYNATIRSDEGNFDHEGYGLYIDGVGGGDYLRMEIDNATGTIKNWVPLTEAILEELSE